MKITEMTVNNFRSITNCSIPLGDFSVFIGKNNAGKSNLLQSIRTLFEATRTSINVEDFYGRENHKSDQFEIQAVLKPISKYIDLIDKQNQAKIQVCIFDDSIKIRRICKLDPIDQGKIEIWNPEEKTFSLPTGIEAALKPILPEIVYIEAFKDPSSEATGKSNATLGKMLKLILQSVSDEISTEIESAFLRAYKKLNITQLGEKVIDQRAKAIKEVEKLIKLNINNVLSDTDIRMVFKLPEIEDLFNQAALEMFDQGIWSSIERKGQGNQRLLYFSLLQALADQSRKLSTKTEKIQKPYILLIEEPEVFLYPSMQSRIGDSLEELSMYNQVIIASHSPQIVTPNRLGKTIIVKKENDQDGVGFSCFKIPDVPENAEEDKHLCKLLSLSNSSEFLFSDRVLIVEGPSDRQILEASKTQSLFLLKLKTSIAIIDCGSKDVINKWCSLLEKIGFPAKAVVDIDFLWNGAGTVLSQNPLYSNFCKGFWKLANENRLLDTSKIEKVIEPGKKQDAIELIKKHLRDEELKIIGILKDKDIWVFSEGELEFYIGLSENTKGRYSDIARNIRDGQMQVPNEFNQIFEWLCS